MVLNVIFGSLAVLSVLLLVWQWSVAVCFPLHRRLKPTGFAPAVTLLKPLKGCDATTESCLRSWLAQDYPGAVQVLFGVASGQDPVCPILRRLLAEFPQVDAQLLVCTPLKGPNLKVSKLAQLFGAAKHDYLVISDADVLVPSDLLRQVLLPLEDLAVGLVNCFYRLANPATAAMHWEAVAINADFWSQVLQSRSLKPLDFALGAVMATRRHEVNRIGGFHALENCLADDYQLGNRIALNGSRIELSPIVVECWSEPMSWSQVWRHQLRWARTIRVCQPVPYFFSILSNPILWPAVWVALAPGLFSLSWLTVALLLRCIITSSLISRVQQRSSRASQILLAPIKDLLQVALWMAAFLGNRIEWRGERYTLRRDGSLVGGSAPTPPDSRASHKLVP